jgi:hypothetical protein
MTKKVFLMLILATAGIAGANAQMRIGGSTTPNQSAVLDLNPDDNTLSGNATLGLALPRVNLRNSSDAFPLVSHVKGMSVYNVATVGDVKPGVYINNGAKWLRQLDNETPLPPAIGKDSIVSLINENALVSLSGTRGISVVGTRNAPVVGLPAGNDGQVLKWNGGAWAAGTDLVGETGIADGQGVTSAGTGLIVSGANNEVMGIADGGVATAQLANNAVTSAKIADGTITAADLSSMGAGSGQVLKWNGTAWQPSADNEGIVSEVDGIIGNEVTGATDNSLIRSGNGTTASPYTLAVSNNGISTRHIENQSVTMEKLSDDILGRIHAPIRPEDLMSDIPNSILVSDANGQWKAQQIARQQIICNYSWNGEHPTGWIDLGYADQTVPAGLYSAHIHINNSGSTIPIDCVVVDAGSQSTYTFPRKNSEARGQAFSIESCLIYKSAQAPNIRLFIHVPGTTRSGLAAIVLEPIIQLH